MLIFYWPSIRADADNVAEKCTLCAWKRLKLRTHATDLRLFPATKPLAYVSINILGPLLESCKDNTVLLVITFCFSKLTRTVPSCTTAAHDVAEAFIKHWGFLHSPESKIFSDIGKNFTPCFFTDLCCILSIANIYTTAQLPQTIRQTQRLNRTLLIALSLLHRQSAAHLGQIYGRAYICVQYPAAQWHWICLLWASVSTCTTHVDRQRSHRHHL